MHFSNSFLILGVVGLLGSTLGTSILAWCISYFSVRTLGSHSVATQKLRLEVLVPAHNEEKLISKTLCSIAEAIQKLKQKLKSDILDVSITVGLDHITDRTLNRIQHFIYYENTDVKIVENRIDPGKWNLLNQMVRESSADWLAFVDSGSLWNDQLLNEILPHLQREETLAVAPSYAAANAGFLEKLNWFLERSLKSIESSSGGPVSVHGATVFYERRALLEALAKLTHTHWLNDDVVIPLTLRTLYPQKRIVYLAKNKMGEAWVTDIGIQRNDEASDFRRRRRMIFGNLQWIHALFLDACRASPVVGMIAARRVFRTFWAYAALFFVVGVILHAIRFAETPSVLFLSAGSIFLIAFLYRMRAAFWAGLEIPFQFFSTGQSSSRKTWN